MALLHKDMYPGLDDNMIQCLKIINVNDVFDFVDADTEKLGRITKMSYQDLKKFKAQIVETFGGKIRSGTELLLIEENYIVSTGIASLDILLNGGLHSKQLYELCGTSSAGKTQICFSLAINIILKTNGIVHYIDTKRDFSANRVNMILEARGHDDEETARVMNRIKITRVTNVPELLSVLYDLTNSLKKSEIEEPTKLVIIDSLPAIILARAENHDSFYSLNHVANVCRFIANEFYISLVIVNLITQWRDIEGFGTKIIDKPVIVKPTLGKFWLHVPNTRLMIDNVEHEKRKITVWKSADLKIGTSCIIDFSDMGVN